MKLIDYIKINEDIAIKNGLEKEAIKILLIEAIYKTYSNLIMDYNNEIPSHYFNIVDPLIKEYLEKKKPVQYILGYAYFYGLKLNVNNNVLIPRPETEMVVENAIKKIKENNYQTVLDIGTGSGAIALAIKKNSGTIVSACDISNEALEVAKENAKLLDLDINFICSDVFSNVLGKFDLIVSNPPYIGYDETDDVSEIVYNNEPHLALFSEDNGLYYYKKIISNLDKYLNKQGTCIFEVGYNQGNKLIEYVNNNYPNYKIEVLKDYNNLDRVVIIY